MLVPLPQLLLLLVRSGGPRGCTAECFRMLQNASKCSGMLQNASKCFNIPEHAGKCFGTPRNNDNVSLRQDRKDALPRGTAYLCTPCILVVPTFMVVVPTLSCLLPFESNSRSTVVKDLSGSNRSHGDRHHEMPTAVPRGDTATDP